MFYFFTLHSTLRTLFSHCLLIWYRYSMIINPFRLVLPFRWSRHWYCPFPASMVLNQVFYNNLVIKERQFVRMIHVISKLTIVTCDIHQNKENAEVKSNRRLSLQAICSSTLVHKINYTHAAIVKLENLRTRN